MDGVLLDTEKYYVKYWVEAGRQMGYQLERKHSLWLRSFAGKFACQMTQLVFGKEFPFWEVRSLRKQMMEPMHEKLVIEGMTGAAKTLDALRAGGIMTAVATASDEKKTREMLSILGLIDKFDRILCTEMVENGKPMSDVYRLACKKLNFKPSECLAVEDSPNGVMAAYSAGCQTVMDVNLTEPDELLTMMICAKINNLPELLDFAQRPVYTAHC